MMTVSLARYGWLLGSGFLWLAPVAGPAQEVGDERVRGGQDAFGAYDIAVDWPRPLAQLPGHDEWTFGAMQSVFAESPDRIFVLQRGELPVVARPPTQRLDDLGPGLQFPVFRLPFRDATVASPPGGGGAGELPVDGLQAWVDAGGRPGIDARWEHCILIFDGEGNLIDTWPQWDEMLARPHAIYISPYDPDRHVWIIDDYRHAIFKFTNDGSELVQTIGTFGEPGSDERHFSRPTFMTWLPDGTFFVADGYENTRVVKFSASGEYILEWGQRGSPPNESRPGFFNNVHGIAADPASGRVFVNDRQNNRIQVFDADGQYQHEWHMGGPPSDIHALLVTSDGAVWAADRGTSKMLKYDPEGRFQYSWGTWGDFPGGFWGVHGISVDSAGNFYVAEVDAGRVQKYIPRPDADPARLLAPARPLR